MKRQSSGYGSQTPKRVKRTPVRPVAKLQKYQLMARPARGDNIISITRTVRVNAFLMPINACTDVSGFQGTIYLQPRLQDFPGYTDFQALFDEYRMIDSNVKFVPRYDGNVSATGDNLLCVLGWAVDHNAMPAITYDSAEGVWLEREGYSQTIFNKEINVKFSPRPNNPVFGTQTGYSSTARAAQWIQTSDAAVPHYGLAVRIYSPGATTAFTQNMGTAYLTATFQFRQPK